MWRSTCGPARHGPAPHPQPRRQPRPRPYLRPSLRPQLVLLARAHTCSIQYRQHLQHLQHRAPSHRVQARSCGARFRVPRSSSRNCSAVQWKPATAAQAAITGNWTTIHQEINDALNRLGADARYIDAQIGYNRDKLDAVEGGLGALIDADIAKEAARLQALQIRQQLGTQTLSITNQAPQALLSLFGGR